MKVKSINTF